MTNRIINALHTNEKPLDVVDLAGLLNEDADDVGAALLELKRAGRVHENYRHRFRLTNEEKVRLRELVIPEPVGDEVSHGGIVNLAAMHQCVPERCDRCRCWTREPDTVFGWCIHNSRMMQPEHGTCGQFQSSEPTDAELDAIEAEVDPDGEAILDSVPEGLREAWNADSEDPYEQKGREQVEDAPRRTYICDTCKHREPYQVGWCSELKRVAKAPECALYEVVEAEESTDQDTCSVCEIFATCTEPDRAADSPVLYADGQPRCAWFKRRSALEADDFEEISGECPDLAVLRAEHAAGAWEENPEAEAAAAGLRALDELCAAAASVQPAACPECGVNEGACECTPKVEPEQQPIVKALTDAEADALVEQWDAECAMKERPTNGLRIEQVARELVEVEARRQELLEELGRLVGGR